VAITGKTVLHVAERGVQKMVTPTAVKSQMSGPTSIAVTIHDAIIKRSNDTVIPVCRGRRQASKDRLID